MNKKPLQVTFDQLNANPDEIHDRTIIIEGFYFHGWEIIVLSEKLEPSSLAEDHLTPKGAMMWVEGGIPPNIHDSL